MGLYRYPRIPGIGPIVATAIVAAIGNGTAFRKGRDFAAWLGVVARQYSTGGKTRLLGISKRGNVYLRKILIHGARAAVLRMKRDRAPIGAWLDALDARAPKNIVVVAMANKLARIAWATHRGLHRNSKDERTVTTACLQPGRREWSRKSNRPTYKDRHARNSSWPGELISITGRIHLRRLAFSPSAFSCSRAADHTFSSK